MSMVKRFQWNPASLGRVFLAGSALLALAGCQNPEDYEEMYQPVAHYERHPIGIAKGSMQVEVPAKSAGISPRSAEMIRRLGYSAADNAVSPVVVARPSGSRAGGAVAAEAEKLLVSSGVTGNRIDHQTYRGGAGSPVVISYVRKFATTPECGNWDKPLNETGSNETYSNFGCAQQYNIAAMVANPEDLVLPQDVDPADANQRYQMWLKLRGGQATASADDKQATASPSDAGKEAAAE